MLFFKPKKHISVTEKSTLPIIIGGCHRSGTTLMRRILDGHSHINCPPEVKFFMDLSGDYLNDELGHVRFFSTARQMGLSADELLDIFGKAFVECQELAAKKCGKVRWADKNPENVLYLDEWSKLLNGKFLFILVVRNPLDTVASLKETPFTKTLPEGFEEKVAVYLRYTELGLKFAKRHPETSYVIRYEDLVSDPTKVVRELTDFIGEDFESGMVTAFNSKKHKVGIEDPKISTTKSIHSKSIERWKKDLTESEVVYVRKKCKAIIKRFGY